MDKELIEFMAQRFDRSERRMEELIEGVRSENRQTRVLIEDLRGQVQFVAGGVVQQGERMDRLEERVTEEFRETQKRLSYAGLEQRMKEQETRMRELDSRVTALENSA